MQCISSVLISVSQGVMYNKSVISTFTAVRPSIFRSQILEKQEECLLEPV
jgi:hypothetical protein